MLGSYLNQQVTYTPWSSTNEYGDVAGSTSSTLACRADSCVRLTQDANGNLFQSSTIYIIGPEVAPSVFRDKMNGKTIIQVQDMRDLLGNVVGYEVLV